MFGALLEVEMSKKSTPLWHETHFQFKICKTHQGRSTFGSWDVEKVRAVVAQSTFPSRNVQNTPFSDHFLKLTCRKSVRCCGANRISKSKVLTAPHVRTTFGRSVVVPCRRCKGLCTLSKIKEKTGFATLSITTITSHHYTTLHCTTLHYAPLHHSYNRDYSYNCNYNYAYNYHYNNYYNSNHTTSLHYTTLHSVTRRYTWPHHNYNYNCNYSYSYNYTTLHYTTLITLHYTDHITLHYTTPHHTTLH